MRVTILASDLGATAGANLAAALAAHLPPRFAVNLVALAAGPSTAGAYLAAAGVTPTVVPVRGPFDVAGLRRLRTALGRPDVLDPIDLRARRLAQVLRLASAVGNPLPDGRGSPQIPTASLVRTATVSESDSVSAILSVPPGARVVFAAGGFDAASDLKSAVWAFDVLRYTAPDWRLVLCGDGPLRPAVERFARGLAFDDYRVRFLGRRADVPALMRRAAAVWVTHRRGGVCTLLEAVAAGVPSAAVGTAELRAVGGGVTFVRPGDPVGLAAVTLAGLPRPGAVPAEYSAEAVAARAAAAYDLAAATLPAGP